MQPIEKVELDDDEEVSLHSKRLHRGMRELKTVQPYGLNDNVHSRKYI